MRFFTFSSVKRLPFYTLLILALFSSGFAQSGEAPRHVKITVEETENGQTIATEKTIPVEGRTLVNDLLREMGVAQELGELKPGEVVELTIKRTLKNEPSKEIRIEVDPQGLEYGLEGLRDMERILKLEQETADQNRPMLGVYYNPGAAWMDETGSSTGAQVTDVIPGSAAAGAGLLKGDVITAVDGDEINASSDLRQVIGKHKAGDKVKITYEREGVKNDVKLTLGEWKTGLHSPENFNIEKFLDSEQMKQLENLKFEFDFDPDEAGNEKFRFYNYNTGLADNHAFLGVQPGDGEGKGAVIGLVIENTTASEMGLKSGDVITSVNGTAVSDFDALREVLHNIKAGENLNLKYNRGGSEYEASSIAKANPEKKCIIIEKNLNSSGDENPDQGAIGEMIQKLQEEVKAQGDVIRTFRMRISMDEPSSSEISQLKNCGSEVSDLDFSSELQADEFAFFPNPTQGKSNIRFTLPESGNTVIRVIGMDGRTVFTESLGEFTGSYSGTVDLGEQADGIYFLVLTQNDAPLVRKIVLQD